jgi:hypothetical protein
LSAKTRLSDACSCNLPTEKSTLASGQRVEQGKNLKQDPLKSIDTNAIPAWGTPEHVRYGYASKLSDLHLENKNETPISLFWLGEHL